MAEQPTEPGVSGGARSIDRFSVHHDITSDQAWTTALVLMAFAEVLSRVGYLQFRRIQIGNPAGAQATG